MAVSKLPTTVLWATLTAYRKQH